MRGLFICALLLLPPSMVAQRFSSPHFSGRPSPMFSHAREGGNYLPSYYGLGLFDPFYADYYSAPAYSSASPPPVIVIQAPAAPAPISASAPMQPLLIELKGDQYVRVSEETQPPQSVEELPASGMLRKPSMNASVSSTR